MAERKILKTVIRDEFLKKGITKPLDISARLNVPVNLVRTYIYRIQREWDPSQIHTPNKYRNIVCTLTPEEYSKVLKVAQSKNLTANRLLSKIIRLIIYDNLWGAVLDE